MVIRNQRPPPTKASSDDEGFLGRWSRRKAEAKAADLPALPAADAELSETGNELPEADTDQNPQLPAAAFDPASLPDIDQMGAGSDFSVFMQAGVPPALKTKALRKLWRVKPELANLDGLLDYGEDLTGSFKVVDHLKTAYEVGKGFLRDQDLGDDEGDKPEEGAPAEMDDPAIAGDEDQPVAIDQTEDEEEVVLSLVEDEALPEKTSKG